MSGMHPRPPAKKRSAAASPAARREVSRIRKRRGSSRSHRASGLSQWGVGPSWPMCVCCRAERRCGVSSVSVVSPCASRGRGIRLHPRCSCKSQQQSHELAPSSEQILMGGTVAFKCAVSRATQCGSARSGDRRANQQQHYTAVTLHRVVCAEFIPRRCPLCPWQWRCCAQHGPPCATERRAKCFQPAVSPPGRACTSLGVAERHKCECSLSGLADAGGEELQSRQTAAAAAATAAAPAGALALHAQRRYG